MEGSRGRRSPSRSAKKPTIEPVSPHRRTDALGFILLAAAAILLIVFSVGNGGYLGDGLAMFFKSLFGKGAWVVPLIMAFAGVTLLAGRSRIQVTRVSYGASLIFIAAIAAFAGSLNGDFFDPEVVRDTGGYVGAIFGSVLDLALKSAKPVGVVLLIALGVGLCVDVPMRELAQWLKDRTRRKAIDVRIREAVAQEDKPRRERKTISAPMEEDTVKPERETKRPVRMTEMGGPREVTFNNPEPKEGYTLPPMSLLQELTKSTKRSPQEMQKNIETLESTLEQFGIDANVVEVANGPTITRYEIQLGPGIRVNRITALADNIAMSLAASHVRVEAPIPGKSAIGVEVPNAQRVMVTLREMCESLEFHDKEKKLCLALGKDVAGVPKYTDLTRMPHVLIGGATNSGKSIALATMIMSLILRHTPKEVRLVMIDPKRVELSFFEGLPHLMCPVVKDIKEAPGVLRAVWREMDRRYDQFSEAGVRNIEGWNEKATFQDKLPYIVVIIDELADLMIQAAAEVETSICRLAQLARATGIHLVIATQRPSVDVITGTIKANIASRIAFSVSSQIDSRTILDQAGAEKLIGRGDMLFLPIDANKPLRVQGCYVTEKEIEQVCHFWRQQEKPHYVLNPIQIAIDDREGEMRAQEESDPLWQESVRFVVERKQASTSMLQRKFSIGFQRASRLLDLMEERGVVGPRDGPRPREVLLDPIQAEQFFGNKEYMTPMGEDEFIDD
jgi:S-DNA-T family DNA segregation ATPase FtsK/SpoIIIE